MITGGIEITIKIIKKLWSLLNRSALIKDFLSFLSSELCKCSFMISPDTYEVSTRISCFKKIEALLSNNLKATAIIKKKRGEQIAIATKYSSSSDIL